MAFPTSPADKQIYNGYMYNATLGAWKRNAVFPIGMTYVQLPNKPSPTDMNWPGTWEDKSSEYAGAFFRVEGSAPYGSARTFETGAQDDQMQQIIGYFDVGQYDSGDNIVGTSTDVFSTSGGGSIRNGDTGSGSSGGTRVFFDSANSPNARTSSTTDGETRPYNYTVKIWERTA